MTVLAPEPLITVSNVYASSKWYQAVLGCTSRWGGLEDDPDHGYDCIVSGETVILHLHAREVDDHAFLKEAGRDAHGQGMCLYLRVDDVEDVFNRARKANAQIIAPPKLNETPGWLELELVDPDGYYLTAYEET
jgi:predicted enzyme related to lactoylglutathione lyase